LGVARLAAELNQDTLSGWLYSFATINFLHFASFLFLICITAMIIVSLFTQPPSVEILQGLTYASTVAKDRTKSRPSWNYGDVFLSVFIVVVIALILVIANQNGPGKVSLVGETILS